MKLLIDYKDEELVNLEEPEKQTMFLLECAERGIPLPDATPDYIPEPSAKDENKADITIYSIGGRYSSDKNYFSNLEDAEAMASLLKKTAISVSGSYRNDSQYIDGKPVDVEIQSNAGYSKEKYSKVEYELNEYDKNKSKVKKNNERRAEIVQKQESVMSEINNSIWAAEKNITRIAELKRIFEQYLKMSNNDREVAIRFLLNAHFSEVADYEDDKLPGIGITREEVIQYEENSRKKEGED